MQEFQSICFIERHELTQMGPQINMPWTNGSRTNGTRTNEPQRNGARKSGLCRNEPRKSKRFEK